MWGVVVGALLIAAGVVLVIHGSYSLDAQRERHDSLLFSSVLTSSASVQASSFSSVSPASPSPSTASLASDDGVAAFLSSPTFGYAMDAPVYTSFYFLNLTNGEQVLSGSAPPQLQQVGPYTYEKKSRKINVHFEATPFQTSSPLAYGYVRYQVVSSYYFAPERSNGTEADRVVTVNATYARKLQKLRNHGYSERLMLAEFAQQHVHEYTRHLRQEFLADTKLRAWSHFLPALVRHAQLEVVPAAIKRQRQRVDSASIPSNLVRMYAVARTEMIPRVLGDVYKDISDRFLPEILQTNLDAACQQALPRVLENLYRRLQVESVPFFLQRQLASQQMRHVPMTLSSLYLKIESIAFPYVLKEVYDRACLEAVPSILRTIKTEIIAHDIATHRVAADVAQRNVMDNWRKQGSTPTNFDAWIDDAPTGKARTGFELLPPSSSLQLSVEAANLILGSKATNKRFSIVDYDAQLASSYPLDQPTATPEGFAIWKQVIAMNETAIAYVLQGVNNDVALVSDYLTRAQLLFIRQYLISWTQSAITQRDRERFWRQSYTKRTANTDTNEPSVDIDIEKAGVQTGFNIQPRGAASTSGMTAAIAQQVWNSSSAFAFTNPQGFTKWQSASTDGAAASSSSVQALLNGIPGLTTAQITEVVSWIQALLQDGFIKRRALRHWSDGTCTSVLQLPLASCLMYDLEPSIAGDQVGFEMNPSSRLDWKATEALRELLWDGTNPASFLVPTHSSNSAAGFGMWLQGIRTANFTRLVDKIQSPSLTVANSEAIAVWLKSWSINELNVLNVHNWWRLSTCWQRTILSVTSVNSVITTSQPTCVNSYAEVEAASTTTSTSSFSPYFTYEKTFHATEDRCVWDSATSTYTRNASTFDVKAQVFSCDAISTSLADDQDASTFGFELMPAASNGADRISLAAAIALWNPLNPFSFLHAEGYKTWHTTSSSSDSTSALQAINAAIDAVCSQIVGGGDRSAIFNETLAAVSCSRLSIGHFESIQAWVRAQGASQWMQDALLDQWRRGSAEELEIEPYRRGDQHGWELATGCMSSQCTLTGENGSVYQVPRTALSLWSASHGAAFVSGDGFSMWIALSNATQVGDHVAIESAKNDIVVACNAGDWEEWMQHVFEWVETWKSSEHALRDVLGHWMHAQCPTTPALVSGIQQQPDVITTTTSCPPLGSRYTVTLNDTIVDLQHSASRPTEYFKPDIVESSALVRPKKTVQVDEAWISCEEQAPNVFRHTVSAQTSLKEYQACNFLSVMTSAALEKVATTGSAFRPLPVTPAEATFEMNRSASPNITIEVAQQIWNQSTPFAFTNLTAFLTKWHPAMNHLDLLDAIANELIDGTNAQIPSDLTQVQEYLTMWESSSISTRRVGIAWLSRNSSSTIDLDIHTDGVQGGFELHPSVAWQTIAGGKLPSFDQGQYLWRAANTFSFLNMDGTVTSEDTPTGFNAWKEIYEGVDWSSEQLVQKYPLEAKVRLQATMQHSLSKDQRAVLLSEMANATTLTESQLRGIAGWLMNWASSGVLRDYILHQWSSGETPRGERDASFDFASHLERLFGYRMEDEPAVRDLFTLTPPLLVKLTTVARKRLWDVQAVGSLVNPNSRVVWCTIVPNGDTKRFCPYVLDDFGAMSTAALETYSSVVQSSAPQEEITKYSNFTKLSVSFLQTQFGIEEEEAIHAIALWWHRLPETSLYFQVSQLHTWRTNLASLSKDPLRFGFDLGFIFPANRSVARLASPGDLVPNTITLGGSNDAVELGACNQSLELLQSLWNASTAASFLHPEGIKQWRQFVQYAIDEAQFLELVETSPDPSAADTIKFANMSSDDVSCTLQAVRNWLSSWAQHPFLRQFVEFLWFQSLESPSSSSLSSPLLANASVLLSAFPLSATNKDARPLLETEESLHLWASLSRILLDANQSAALVHPEEGFPVWKSLLINCFSSNAISAECQNSSSHAFQEYKEQVSTAESALAVLVDALRTQMTGIDNGNQEQLLVGFESLASVIRARVVPWMIGWLDHPLFERFVLQHVREAEPPSNKQATSFYDLAMVQFVNGSVTRANYSTPAILDSSGTGDGRNVEIDIGRASERFPRHDLVFDATKRMSTRRPSSFLPGFGELQPFCELHSQDIAFAYDAPSTMCKLNTDYFVAMEDASALVDVFSDTTPWWWNSSNDATRTSTLPNSTRTALLIDAFLAQPFATLRECEFVLENIATAYELTGLQKSQSCVQGAAAGIYLDLPMLASVGFPSKPKSFVTDLQAYLRYAATKFGYEPRVLGRQPVDLFDDAARSHAALPLEYPIGGYLASSPISNAIFTRESNPDGGFWRNDSIADGDESPVLSSSSLPSPQLFTVQVPLQQDPELFAKRTRVVGEILAIDNATEVTVWGVRVVLSGVRVTDGSQFTTLVLSSKYLNGGANFPPAKLLFYWEYARRLLQLEYLRNTTRFGIPLMRYKVADWLEPTSLPSGIADAGPSEAATLLNMSLLLDDLQFALSAASPLSGETTVDVDPLTGSVYHRRLVWQLNARVQSGAARDVWHESILDCWLPIVWIQEQSSVSPANGLSLANAAKPGPFAKEKVATWEVVGGCVYVVVGAALMCFFVRRARLLRLHRLESVLPEQTVCLLESESSRSGAPSSPGVHSSDAEAKAGLRHREVGTVEIEPDRQPLTTPSQSARSEQSTLLDSTGSRRGRRKTQRIQTIIEQTEGIGEDAESNGGAGRLAKFVAEG